MKRTHTQGFTLIELLVVIAIIGVLAALVTASINDARAKSRDTARISQLQEIQTALELFHLDNGGYPAEGVSGEDSDTGIICSSCGSDISNVLSQYMRSIPQDPLNNHDGNSTFVNGEFYFYYDGNHNCTGQVNQAVVYAVDMEDANNSNEADTICSAYGGEGGITTAGADAYVIVLGPSANN